MAIVQEQFRWPALAHSPILTGDVCEKVKGEHQEPWEIISIQVDTMKSYTPDNVIKLGEILIELGNRVKKQYTSTGKFKGKKQK